MIKIFMKIVVLLSFYLVIFYTKANDLYIRQGIDNVFYGSSPEYIAKLNGGGSEGNRLKQVALNHWHSISDALDEILSWPDIPGFHVIRPKVAGYLKDDGVRDPDASKIGMGIQEYAKGAR